MNAKPLDHPLRHLCKAVADHVRQEKIGFVGEHKSVEQALNQLSKTDHIAGLMLVNTVIETIAREIELEDEHHER